MTKIEWCDETWNPITGCTPCSIGCENCYAKRMATRLAGRFGYPQENPFAITFHEDKLGQPLNWKKQRRIFVCSMGDIFHPNVSFSWRYKIDQIIQQAFGHTFMILTKRPVELNWFCYPHVWMGVTIENQEQAEKRIPDLISKCYGKQKIFVSCEPLLGPIDLEPWIDKLDWVIVGQETGPRSRVCKMEWVSSIADLCSQKQVPYFAKKLPGSEWYYHSNFFRREFPIEK